MSDTPREIYSNNVTVQAAGWDISMLFAVTTGWEGNRSIQREDARIIMSPPFAKVVARMLAEIVAEYEAAYGPIPTITPRDTGQADAGDEEVQA